MTEPAGVTDDAFCELALLRELDGVAAAACDPDALPGFGSLVFGSRGAGEKNDKMDPFLSLFEAEDDEEGAEELQTSGRSAF